VFKSQTVEATSRDLAADAGVAPWRVPKYLKTLETLGYVTNKGDGVWHVAGFEDFAQIRAPDPCTDPPSSSAQMRTPGVHTSAPQTCTDPRSELYEEELSEVELCEEEPSHPLPLREGTVCGNEIRDSKRKGRKRLGIAERVVEAGGDRQVVEALQPVIVGIDVPKRLVDPVAFMVEMARDLEGFCAEDIGTAARALQSGRSVWPSIKEMHQAVVEASDPGLKTLHWRMEKVTRHSRYGDPVQDTRWVLTLNDEARAEFERLGHEWSPPENLRHRYPAPDQNFQIDTFNKLKNTPIAGRALMAMIRAWVDKEMARTEARHAVEGSEQNAA
jgi:hypothetical protein